jgi:hypothetical protein
LRSDPIGFAAASVLQKPELMQDRFRHLALQVLKADLFATTCMIPVVNGAVMSQSATSFRNGCFGPKESIAAAQAARRCFQGHVYGWPASGRDVGRKQNTRNVNIFDR